MPTIRRRNKYIRREKPLKAEVVTGNFSLHYEDVVNRNRFALIAIFATGLVLVAAFIPSVIDRSLAKPDHVSVEAEQGAILNADKVRIINDDITANGESYLEFTVDQ